MSLKDNLKRIMEEKRMSIPQLAHQTNISVATLKRLRSVDNANTTIDVLMKLSRTLSVPMEVLLKDNKQVNVRQDTLTEIPDTAEEFIVSFTKPILSLRVGTKALFKRYSKGDQLTKYIVHKSGKILERVYTKEDDLLFRDDEGNVISVEQESIVGYIAKELYEVEYG